MFKKAANVTFKGETKLRGKEAKKLQAAVAAQLGGEETALALLPGKADVVVKKAGGGSTVAFIFIDEACSLIQPDGRAAIGDSELVPALSALWKVGAEALLPCVLIQRPVAKFIFKGANVMAPGIHSILVPGDGAPAIGALVAVRCVGNPHACAVGRLRMAVAALSGPLRVKGEAVEVLHYFGDALWEASGSPRPAGFIGDTVQATDADEEARLAGGVAGLADEEDEGEPGSDDEDEDEGAEGGASAVAVAAPAPDVAEKAAPCGGEAADAGGEDTNAVTPQEMTRAMEECFLQAAKTRIKNKDLPLAGNALYAQHMRPCRRAGTNIDVKASTYKKLGAFMAHLEELGWLALKKKSAEPVVTKVEFDHPDIRQWQPWPRGATAEAAEPAAEAGPGGGASSASAKIEVEAVFRVSPGKCADLIGALGPGNAPSADDGVWTRAECAEALQSYVDSRNLWMQNNRKRFRPDDLLLGLISGKDLNLGESSGLSVDGLVDRVVAGLPAFHRVTAPQGGAVGGVKRSVRPGKPPTVQVKTDTRRGHHVTLAYGLEAYGVEMEAFAEVLKKALACSTTVETQPQVAVMVQGFWDVAVVEWLAKVGIPEESIQHQVKKGQQQKKVKQASNVVRA